MAQQIPAEVESFNSYIINTDDCQRALVEHTVYPADTEGKTNYLSPDKKVLNEPAWMGWNWTEEESRQWSLYRQRHDQLYRGYSRAEGVEQNSRQELLNENISACIAYSLEHRLLEHIALSGQTTLGQLQTFGIKQDILQYKTPLRTITIQYEKQNPLSDFEKEFIDKYIALHNLVPERTGQILGEINELHSSLPGLWKKISIVREKADKASNTISLPPPEMKGSYSPVTSFKILSAEETQQHVDDFNAYIHQFQGEINSLCDRSDALAEEVYDEDANGESRNSLFNEVDKMHRDLHKSWEKYSIETMTLHDDFDEFLEAWGDEDEKITAPWSDFIKEQHVFMDVYNALVVFLNEKFNGKEEDIETVSGPPSGDPDDIRTETIKRYESEMNSGIYFDIDDWHIILDHYEHKHDGKNKDIALEKAFAQHPQNATLLLRKAQEEAGKHEYQKALAFVKQAEAQGPPHHPNFYFIKANIFCQVHAPEQAIPLYNKLIASRDQGLEWFQEHARYRLIDIYAGQKKYFECIELCKELLEKKPDDENTIADLCSYYREGKMFKEAEEAAKNFLQKFPNSSQCMEQLGLLYLETGEYEKAAEQFENSYAVNKNENYGRLFHKGKALIALKRFSEAAVCFETCLFYYHLDKEYHLAAAQCYKQLKMPYAAAYHYRQALALDPECAEALQQLQTL